MTPEAPRPSKAWRRAFWCVVLAALVIRLPGIVGQGFPECFYPDETNAIQRTLKFGAEKTADPGWFNKPALAYYLWFAEYAALYVGGRAAGTFASADQFGVWAFSRVAPFLLLGRLLSTLFGVATVWMTYLLGKRLRGRVVGLTAALALALTYAHVVTGQWVKEDVPAGFFHTAGTVLLVGVITKARTKDSMSSGFLGGLGMATKYYSVGLLIPATFAHLFPAKAVAPRMGRRIALLATFFVLFVAGFFVGSPFNFLRRDFFAQQVMPTLERAGQLVGMKLKFGAIGFQQASRFGFVDRDAGFSIVDTCAALVESLYIPDGIGFVFFILAVGGLVLAIVRHTRLDVFMLVAILGQALFIAIGNRQFSEPRHLVVLYPLLAVWIAETVVFLSGFAGRLLRGFSPVGVSCALLLLLAAVPARGPSVASMLVNRALEPVRGHTHLEALRWIEKNVPAGSVIIDDHEVLPLLANEARSDWAIDRLKTGRGADAWSYRRRWEYRKAAVAKVDRPSYDLLVIEAPWETENVDPLQHRNTYDLTWPLDVASRPADVPPVARYTDVPEAARKTSASNPASRAAFEETWPAAKWLLGGRPVEWLVSKEETYNNYLRPSKRRNFPNRAAFYDDLKAHYDCRQWSGTFEGLAGRTIRVYDLRKRLSGNPAVIEMSCRSP